MEDHYNLTLEQGFLLEELLGLREMEYYQAQNHLTATAANGWVTTDDLMNFTNNIHPSIPISENSFENSFENYSLNTDQHSFNTNSLYAPFSGEDLSPTDHLTSADSFSAGQVEMSHQLLMPSLEESYFSMVREDELFAGFETVGAPFKVEPVAEMASVFDVGFCSPVGERKSKAMKKVGGQQSKNLMAERRRRKRLNDRLSMLRSVVPKISKMDRTSILGDTIDYMKELLDRINNLQEEMQLGSNELGLMSIFKDVKPHEILVRNSPKFDVERRDEGETRIEICCAGKPGLLLSTVTTLEALGLEIQHCVISCFNDFATQASCSHLDMKQQRAILESEDIKQALFRNAGYAGKCL